MDGNRFDDLSRKLATGISRRKAIKGIAAGVAGALGFRGAAEAQNQVPCSNVFCANNPGICNPGCVCCLYYNPIIKQVVNSRCRPPGSCAPADVLCPTGKVYDPARGCVAPCTGPSSCPQSAAGSCQVATCSSGGLCSFGPAPGGTSCGAGKACCGGACISTTTTTNCGTCGNACTANQVCTGGTCTCPNDTCGATCCAPGQVCIGGVCRSRGGPGAACDPGQNGDCQQGLTCCGTGTGVCTQLGTTTNCGSCGDVCNDNNPCTTNSCSSSSCVYTPVTPDTLCTTSGGVNGSCNASGTCVPFFCTPGSTRACYTGPAGTQNVGVCHGGTQTCNSAGSAYGPCAGQVLPSQEACNGSDDDCDGQVDEGDLCAAGQSCINGSCTCTPETTAQTCARQGRICGPATNFCSQTVQCGTCDANETCTGTGQCTCPTETCGTGEAAVCCDPATPLCGPNDTCVECEDNGDCGGGTPVCKPTTNTCVECVADTDCSGDTPVCNPGTSTCVECVASEDCTGTGEVCTNNTCGCTAETDAQACARQGRICGPTTNNCGDPVLTCGTCDANETCTGAGQCTCPTVTCGTGVNEVCCDPGLVCISDECAERSGVGEPCDLTGDNDCESGLTCCSGTCRDLTSDPNNCNTCGVVCPPGSAANCEGAAICTHRVCGTLPATSGTVCRAGVGECGADEFCDGQTKVCPDDVNQPNGTTCGTAEECCGGICCDAAIPVCGPNGTCVECEDSADCAAGEVCKTSSGTCVECVGDADCSGGTPICNTSTNTCAFCVPGSTQACYTGPAGTQNVGVCQGGTWTCNAEGTAYGACVGQVLPSPEVCDGLDNDCDGTADEGATDAGAPCDTGQMGICAAGTTQCQGGAIVCVRNQQPQTEICNGLDDDCDGLIDDGATCPAGQSCISGACVCTPETPAQACARQGRICGSTTNFCGQTVACGDCQLGSTCNSAGQCIVSCGAASSTGCTGPIGTQGSCCNGLTCGEGNVCVEPCEVNRIGGCVCTSSTQCPTTGATCCRTVGSGAQCKPGVGGCIT